MSTVRRAIREELTLPVTMRLQGEQGSRSLRGRTVDLSETGVGLIVHKGSVEPGTPVSVMIEDVALGRVRERIWQGEVVFDRSTGRGSRLGVSFLDDLNAYSERIRIPKSGGRGRSYRLDDCRPESANEQDTACDRWLTRFALGGFGIGLLSQLVTSNDFEHLVRPSRAEWSAADLTPLAGLGLAGILNRLGHSAALEDLPGARAGLGLVMGGVLAELARIVALTSGRPPVLLPSFATQILAASGVAMMLGAFLRRQACLDCTKPNES